MRLAGGGTGPARWRWPARPGVYGDDYQAGGDRRRAGRGPIGLAGLGWTFIGQDSS